MGKALHIKSANKRIFFALSLGVLGENEREDLCDILKNVWLPGEPGTPDPFAEK
jgi:hypothetical protein